MRGRVAVLSDPVVAVGLGLVALQAVFRAWALYPSWFYTDDYRLIQDAVGRPLSLDYLLRPFDSQLMPLGRLLAWIVADAGRLNWTVAATLTLALQVLAGLTFLWMLVTVFGRRWGVLAPLVVYLTSALAVPAMMWWAASLNQLPLLIAVPAAIGAWVGYLRTRRLRCLGLTVVAVAFGFLAYVKTVLLVLVLAYLVLALFGTGGPISRIQRVLRDYWPAALAFCVLGGGYAAYYLTQVPSVFKSDGETPARDLAGTMLGRSFATGAVGGPVRWLPLNPPVATADPPAVLVVLAWVVLAGFVGYTWLARRRTGRVWLLLLLYLSADYLALLGSRAPVVGAYIGTELRYLTDSAPVFALCVGLATMAVPGAPQGTGPREEPLLLVRSRRRSLGRRTAVIGTMLVACLGLLSTVRYVDGWHHHNPGEEYLHHAMTDLAEVDRPTLAGQRVPDNVMPAYSGPYNLTDNLLPLADDDVAFPDATDRLLVLDSAGHLRRARIETGVRSRPGPDRECGWRVSSPLARTIPLSGRAFAWDWWVRIGYLSSGASPVTVSVPGAELDTQIRRGLNSLYVRLTGPFDHVTLGGLADGVTLCVDTVEVGNAVPGGPL